jgi:ATP-dependent Clp protease ATP-binding subunit ClpC
MARTLTDQARQVLEIAQQEARSLNHDFVGTEHLLLALLHDDASESADVLRSFGLDAERVRREIEKLITRGSGEIERSGELPLTPRARRAIDCAGEIARLVDQKLIGTEHLIIGLFREEEGFAAMALSNLGLKRGDLSRRALRVRLEQMKLVEKVVRGVRVGIARKRKMREELLAHLESIYAEEHHSPKASDQALAEAARRFGDPQELAREFDQSASFLERASYHLEQRFGWRAPETGTRWMARLALQMAVLILIGIAPFAIILVAIVAHALEMPAGSWKVASMALAPAVALLLVAPADVFLLGSLYFKIRDALHGAFGARKSRSKVFVYTMLYALVVFVSGVSFNSTIQLMSFDPAEVARTAGASAALALLASLYVVGYARAIGPKELRDTFWALLKLEEAAS